MNLGRPAQCEQEEVLALDFRQHQGARDAVEHVGRRRAASSLFEPCVPSRTDVGALSHFFAPQSGRSPACQRKAECRRIEFRAAILQVGAKVIGNRHTQPISHYTRITSLLYHDSAPTDIASMQTRRISPCVSLLQVRPGSSAPPLSKNCLPRGTRYSASLARMRRLLLLPRPVPRSIAARWMILRA